MLVRRPATLRAWLTAYAAATATPASYNAILDAATPGEGSKLAKTTTVAYRDVLSQIWLSDPIPGWLPTRNRFTRLAQAPKHHLADPSLAARLLGASTASLLLDAAIITTGTYAYRRPDGIAVIPAALLGP